MPNCCHCCSNVFLFQSEKIDRYFVGRVPIMPLRFFQFPYKKLLAGTYRGGFNWRDATWLGLAWCTVLKWHALWYRISKTVQICPFY